MISFGSNLLAYEAARMSLARLRVPGGVELKNAFAQTTQIAAKTLRVARVGCWLYLQDRAVLRCFHLQEETNDTAFEGTIIEQAECPAYFAAIARQSILPISDAWHDPVSAELRAGYLEPLGVGAMLDVPVFLDGVLKGVVCHEHVGGPREWTAEEQALAKNVADTLGRQALEAQKAHAQTTAGSLRLRAAEIEGAEALGRFAASIGHDLRNLLQTILAPSSMIAADPALHRRTREMAEMIEHSAGRATELVNDLMTFGRRDARQPFVFDLVTAAERTCRAQAQALDRRWRLVFDSQPGSCRALFDPVQFDRLLTNLIVNARDAMPEGGEIGVSVHPTSLPQDGHTPVSLILIEVRDSGIGMDEETKERVFEPYFSTKPKGKGTGLGLAIVAQIVERSGGFIHVESEPGQGTVFRVFLPRIAGATG
ncbi:MAG: GAF domain-containing sensor histidine kinase [Chthoniobacter sp.]|nr:GAF domain-containing sensor histidine kinase [Chthoniobacter sp.]